MRSPLFVVKNVSLEEFNGLSYPFIATTESGAEVMVSQTTVVSTVFFAFRFLRVVRWASQLKASIKRVNMTNKVLINSEGLGEQMWVVDICAHIRQDLWGECFLLILLHDRYMESIAKG